MEPTWISIKNKLPEKEEVYLAFFNTPNDKFVETVFFYEGNFVLPGMGSSQFITHWMHLPTFPSDEKDNT